MKTELNLDVPGSIQNFENAMKYFSLRNKIYRIIFRGKGPEFDGFRIYGPDDDASVIDWVASARAQKTLVRQYKEERDQKILFLIDVGDNMVFGSTKKLKCEYAAEMALAFGHLISISRDKLGFVLFSDRIVDVADPRGGMTQFFSFLNSISDASHYGGQSNIEKAIKYVSDHFTSINSVIIISDFIKVSDNFRYAMKLLSTKFEVMTLMVKDPLDIALPDISTEVVLEGSGQQLLINPHIAKESYSRISRENEVRVLKMLRDSDVDNLSLLTDKDFSFPLAKFLKERVFGR